MTMIGRTLTILALFNLTGCHLIFSFVTDAPDADGAAAPCGKASPTCWDVSAVFHKTDVEYPQYPQYSPQIFDKVTTDGQTVHALLDGTSDNTYAEPLYTPSNQCASWIPSPFNTPRTWDIERKLISPGTYKILVRGSGAADCAQGGIQPDCSGEVRINLKRGWRIDKEIFCSVTTDTMSSNNVFIPTHCTVDKAVGTISWRSGSSCGGCCACPKGASVKIEVVVSK